MLYVKDDILSGAGIGKLWKLHHDDGSVREGILSSLSADQVIYIPSGEESACIGWQHIDYLEPPAQTAPDAEQDWTGWWKEKEALVSGSGFRAIFPPEAADVVRALLDRIQTDWAAGLKELLPRVLPVTAEKAALIPPLACFYHELRDGAGCFYWLSRYFTLAPAAICDSPLWWGYLKYAISFDCLSEVWKQLERLYETDPVLSLQSAAFLFFLQANHHKGALLYWQAMSPPPDSGWLSIFYSALSAQSDMEECGGSFFCRYRLRTDQILENGLYRSYDSDQGLSGYVYHFVESRGYCMVLGLDLMSYFLHFDLGSQGHHNFTPQIRKKLRRELNVRESIADELPVRVAFCRDRRSRKRTYSITHAQLDTSPLPIPIQKEVVP